MKKLMFILISCLSLLACEEIDMSLLEDVKSKIDTSKQSLVTPVTPVVPIVDIPVVSIPAIVPSPVVTNTDQFDMIYKRDWENDPLGNYTRAQFTKDFNKGLYEWGLGDRTDVYDPKSGVIVENLDQSNTSKYFRSNFPQGKSGANSGFCLEGELGKKYEEAYFSYNVRFKPGFNFVDGGKLLGLSGGNIVVPNPPDGNQGFRCVLMWQGKGTIQSYIYHQAQTAQYGEGGNWTNSQIPVGEWFNITIRVVMNDVGKANGIFEGFINGKLAFSSQHYQFRSVSSMGIHKIEFHSYFGGSGEQYSAVQNEYIDFDDLIVYKYKDGANIPRGLQTSAAGRQLELPGSIAGKSQLAVSSPVVAQTGKTIISVTAYGVEVSKENAHMKVYSNGSLIGETFVSTAAKEYQFQAIVNADQISNVRVEYDNDYYNEATGADRNLIVKSVKVGTNSVDMAGASIVRSQTVWLDNGSMFFAGNGDMKINF